MEFKNHDLDTGAGEAGVDYAETPLKDAEGCRVEGLHCVRITLDNPSQLNSYTTEMVKDVILAFRRASNDRRAVAVVFTGAGTRAFCTGGNVTEYAEYYAGRPAEYAQYMRLFNDMVTSILTCDLPVICRVNGMRIAGGQEIGMACDLSIAWTLFSAESRRAFRAALPLDEGTWARGRGWTLWKALIVLAGVPGTDPKAREEARRVLDEVLAECR